MTAGSYCYIGPQGIVHGTVVCINLSVVVVGLKIIFRLNNKKRVCTTIALTLVSLAHSAKCRPFVP